MTQYSSGGTILSEQ